jgi:CHAT domain-containing protein
LGDPSSITLGLLQFKGVVLDSLMEDRYVTEASRLPEQRTLVEQAHSAKLRLLQVTLQVPKNLSADAMKRKKDEREQFRQEVEEVEGRLARSVTSVGKARRALTVTMEDVQAALPPRNVLVEFVRQPQHFGPPHDQSRYGAVILANSGEPKWIVFESAIAVEKTIALYQKSVRGETDRTTLEWALKELYEQVWKPIDSALPEGIRTVILSPDGKLGFVSFATLLTPSGQFLGQKYTVRYFSSGRDLLLERPKATDLEMAEKSAVNSQ